MDGVDLARRLRKTRPLLPVLLASGSNKRVEQAAKEFRTFQKPYDIDRLDDAIQVLLRERDGRKDRGNLVDLNKIKQDRKPKN
jgi:DNA-binding response OmpR family regulator